MNDRDQIRRELKAQALKQKFSPTILNPGEIVERTLKMDITTEKAMEALNLEDLKMVIAQLDHEGSRLENQRIRLDGEIRENYNRKRTAERIFIQKMGEKIARKETK